jgi:hypothetical protein
MTGAGPSSSSLAASNRTQPNETSGRPWYSRANGLALSQIPDDGDRSSSHRASGASRHIPHPPDFDSEDDLDGLDDDHDPLRLIEHFSVRAGDLDEERIRAHQLLRGQLSSKRVASRSAISSLESIEVDALPENERSRSFLLPHMLLYSSLTGRCDSLRDLL